jgi:aminodeoxyfutalosine synthase
MTRQRLDRQECLDLARRPVHDIGQKAYEARLAQHGRKAFYVFNQHLNYTNICRNACRFCAYSRRKGQRDAYVMSLDEARSVLEQRNDDPVREVHIVGGLNPELPYDYYLGLVRMVRDMRPRAVVKAFTAVEIAFLADAQGLSEKRILSDLKEHGVQVLPGGGAEVFSPELRRRLCPEKISGRRWLDIHEQAHELGIRTNCTMLFGHVESWEDRIDHMLALRRLQDKTGGFLCFIPLPYQPGNNALKAKGPDGEDFLRTIAASRLVLDNISHIKAYWVFSGIKAAQMGLWAGADDFDGTLVRERIGHAAGADSPQGLTISELQGYIRAAGFEPVERDTFFQPVTDTA